MSLSRTRRSAWAKSRRLEDARAKAGRYFYPAAPRGPGLLEPMHVVRQTDIAGLARRVDRVVTRQIIEHARDALHREAGSVRDAAPAHRTRHDEIDDSRAVHSIRPRLLGMESCRCGPRFNEECARLRDDLGAYLESLLGVAHRVGGCRVASVAASGVGIGGTSQTHPSLGAGGPYS